MLLSFTTLEPLWEPREYSQIGLWQVGGGRGGGEEGDGEEREIDHSPLPLTCITVYIPQSVLHIYHASIL